MTTAAISNQQHTDGAACGATRLIPAGVHVSPTHLARNETHHTCALVEGHRDPEPTHRCRCGISFYSDLAEDIADMLWRIEGNYHREGAGPGSRFEGERLEIVQARAVIRRVREASHLYPAGSPS